MKNFENNEQNAQIKRRYVRRQRFYSGLRELTVHHRAKVLIPLVYLLALSLAWVNRGAVLKPIFDSNPLVSHSMSFALLFVGVFILVEIIIVLGTPRKASEIQNALVEAGFVNSSSFPPLLFSIRKAAKAYIYEFDLNNTPLSHWERDKEKIGAALRCTVISVKLSKDGCRVLLHAVPLRSSLPDKIYWKDKYLSPEDFVLVLGMSLNGDLETFDLSTIPHILIGGGTGSGKSLFLKYLIMQTLKKGAAVILADFKGGVDYASIWHKKCKMVFDSQTLLTALAELTVELERRRELFVAAGTPNLAEYNKATGESLPRYIFACDEVAEILDMTGLDKGEKAILTQIVRHLSLIARQGRAFGIHLILSTQRPSADLIPGQIRTNLTLRICGRADDILSRIILDNPAAAEQIPLDAAGRFVTNMGQTFQGFLFNDSILEDGGDHGT